MAYKRKRPSSPTPRKKNKRQIFDDSRTLDFSEYKRGPVKDNPSTMIMYIMDGTYDKYNNRFYIQGLTKDGKSASMTVNGHVFKFYTDVVTVDKDKMNTDLYLKYECSQNSILNIDVVKRRNVNGYNKPKNYCCWYLSEYTAISKVISLLRDRGVSGFYNIDNGYGMDPITSFQVNTEKKRTIKFCSYVKIENVCHFKTDKSTCQYNFSADYYDIEMMKQEGDYFNPPTQRTLSFDIETSSVYPENGKTYQIGCSLREGDRIRNILFCLDTCSGIRNTQIYSFKKEKYMLIAFRKFVQAVDPDIMTGYNIEGFDLYYILERADKCGVINEVNKLARCTTTSCKCFLQKNVGSAQRGYRDKRTTRIAGRVVMDVMPVVKEFYKLPKYSLNHVSRSLLGDDEKDDVHFTEITPLQQKDQFTRAKLGKYCIKDCILPLKLIKKCGLYGLSDAISSLTGAPLNKIIDKGQGTRIGILFHHTLVSKNMISEHKRLSKQGGYQGAHVLEPIAGVHKFVDVYDFKSLYPSIMRQKKLCISTHVLNASCDSTAPLPEGLDLAEDDVIRIGGEGVFVKPEKAEGFIPHLLKDLGDSRTDTKLLMKQAKKDGNVTLEENLDVKQRAFKITANSVYGILANESSFQMADAAISRCVTYIGREMIVQLKKYMNERKFVHPDLMKKLKDVDYWKDISQSTLYDFFKYIKVVYGDTDSVMVKNGLDLTMGIDHSIERSIDLSNVIATQATEDLFEEPHELEFEKLFIRMLLPNVKKKYAAYMVETAKDTPYIYKSGIAKKRDLCDFVKNTTLSVIECILKGQLKKAIDVVANKIVQLHKNECPLNDFVMTKTVSKPPDQYASLLPHIKVAKEMKKGQGERISYLIAEGEKLNKRLSNFAFDPEYAMKNGKKINVAYYSDLLYQNVHSLINLAEPGSFERSRLNTMFASKKNKTPTIKGVTYKQGVLKGFKIRNKCQICSTLSNDVVCPTCLNSGLLIPKYKDACDNLREIEDLKLRNDNTCRTCKKSEEASTSNCRNDSCPIYFDRMEVKIKYEDCVNKVDKLNDILVKCI